MDGERNITRHTASVPVANNEIFNWKTIQGATILVICLLVSINKSCYAQLDYRDNLYIWNTNFRMFRSVVALRWNKTTIGNGVFISQASVITSANIIDRLLSKNVNLSTDLTVYSQYRYLYKAIGHKVACYTTVVKNETFRNSSRYWVRQGFTYDNSPIHDLYVLGLAPKIGSLMYSNELMLALPPAVWPHMFLFPKITKYKGPGGAKSIEKKYSAPRGIYAIQPEIGDYKEQFESIYWTHASFGCCSKDKYDERKGILIQGGFNAHLIDCDEWLPREWGHFICITAENPVEVLASGSPLFYKETLYGLASFSVTKNDETIHVFTDLRWYRTHMYVCLPFLMTIGDWKRTYFDSQYDILENDVLGSLIKSGYKVG